MNDDDGEQKASFPTHRRTGPPPMNLYTGVPAFSNPFTKIAHEASYTSSSPSRAPNPRPTASQNIEMSGKTVTDHVSSRHVKFESPTQMNTPQKRPVLRPFQPLGAHSNSNSNIRGETASNLSPYVNFLNGSKPSSTPSLLAPMSATPNQRYSSPHQERGGGDGDIRDENEPEPEPGSLGPASTTSASDDIVLDELKDVYTSLAEQTKQSENLRYQLITLKNARNQVTKEHQMTKDELNQTKVKLEEAFLKINNQKSLIETNEVRFNGKIQDLNDIVRVRTAENDKLLEELDGKKREVEDVKVLLRLEIGKGDAMRAKVDETKKKMLDLATVFHGLEKGMQGLGDSQLAYRKLVDKTAQELTELRRSSAEAAGRVSEHGENRQFLGQVRVTLAELKEELADSQRVNDLLRDKLHNTSAQLADVTGRLREVENEKREIWSETLQRVARHVELQESVIASEKELVGKFCAFEDKDLQLSARSAELETKMVEITTRNQEMDAELMVLRPLQQENLQLQAEVLDLSQRLAEETSTRKKAQGRLEESKDALISVEKESLVVKTQIQDVLESRREVAAELSNLRISHKELESNFASFREKSSAREKEVQAQYEARLSAVQEVVNKRDQEISAFQAKVTLGEDMRDQLRTTLSQEQATTSRLRQELKETTIREAIAMGKVDLLEGRIVNLTRELENKEDMIRQLSCKAATAQDRFEAQASTLRLTKEELGDMQEKLSSLIVCHETALGKIRLENAVTQEQKSSLLLTNEKLSAEMKAQEDTFAKKFEEFQITIDGLESVIKERGERIAVADRESTNAKRNEDELKAKVIQLEGTIEQMNKEKEEELGMFRTHETDRVLALEGQVATSKKEIEDLKKEKEEFVTSRNTLLKRYTTGHLSDVEKDFTLVLLANARELHEQASVAKDNEIKRRDKAILGLQERNSELESMLAQMLQPTDMDPSLLLSLKISPPHPRLQDAAHALPQPQQEQQPIVAVTPVVQTSEIDIIPPIPSQIPSELSTPPQSPHPSRLRGSTISFVQLSNEDSEKDENQPQKAPSLKRFGDEPETSVGATKKRLRVGVSKKAANQEGNKAPEARGRGRPKKRKGVI